MQVTLLDTGPLVALFNRRDHWHVVVREYFSRHASSLLTTWAVLAEVNALMPKSAWFNALEWIEHGGLSIAEQPESTIVRIAALSRKYHDLPMDLADASLVVLAEQTAIDEIVTIDSDFDVYRFGPNRPFKNLLRPYMNR